MKKFTDDGIPVIELISDGVLMEYDLDNCYDIFCRCLGERKSFDDVLARFDELWHSGEVLKVQDF
jgi:hypothetical protein